MPVGKPIAECLQALGVLEFQSRAQTKTQWPENAKSLNEAIASFAISIEGESHAHGAGETLSEWVKQRATEWVQSNGERWSAKNRGMLLPHAPDFPADRLFIVYWVQQYILNKWHVAAKNRKTKETPGHFPLPGLDSYDSESDVASPTPAAASTSNVSSISTMVPYEQLETPASQGNDPSHNTPSNTPLANDFRSRTYAPIIFQVEISARITFLIGPSVTRDGYGINSYARIMGFGEAHDANTFRAGVYERLGEMGEVIGSRKLVARPDWMAMAFVVESEHDHHFLFEILKAWGESQKPGLCIVHVSLEHEV